LKKKREKCECTEEKECKCGEFCECGDECNCETSCECHECDHSGTCDSGEEVIDNKHEYILYLENVIKELQDKLIRKDAEMQNYKKRKDEETLKMLIYANEDFAKEVLPVMDSFSRAISMDDNELDDEVSKFLSGFKMIYCNFISLLEHHEIKEIEALGKSFDPAYHQAVMTEESDTKDVVLEVLQKGYMYKDRVIRPAMVKTSV